MWLTYHGDVLACQRLKRSPLKLKLETCPTRIRGGALAAHPKRYQKWRVLRVN